MQPLLARLDDAAAKLATTEVPTFGGRLKALDRAALSMRVLGHDAASGVEMLERAGIDPDSIRAVREASRMLGSKPLLERYVHEAARSLRDAVADVRTRNADLLAATDARIEREIAPARAILAELAGAPTAQQRAALADALRFDPSIGPHANSRLHDRLLESVPTSARIALLKDMVANPAHELQPDELRLLGRLIQGRQVGRTGGVLDFNAAPPYISRLEEAIAGSVEGINPRRPLELDRYFARDLVIRMPEHERLDMATALFSKDVSELTQREWNLLEQLVNKEVVGFDSPIVSKLPDHEEFSRHIAFRTMQGLPPSETMYAYFDANALKGVSNAERARIVEARFESALDEAANGSLSKTSQTLLTASWPAAADRVSRMPIERQSAIATTLLGLPSGPSGNLESVRMAVTAIDDDLATMTVPEQFRQLLAQTKVLIVRNLGRMEGRHDPNAVRGYGIHPDYAEVGQIRANTVLLRAARDMADRTAPPIAPTSSTRVTETLTW